MQFSLWLLVAVVGVMVAQSEAEIWTSSPIEDPERPGKCWNLADDVLYDVGAVFTDHKHCYRISCFEDFSMEFLSCDATIVGKGDSTLDYPDCCPIEFKEPEEVGFFDSDE